jgi:ABC-type transporter Mla MlaB component
MSVNHSYIIQVLTKNEVRFEKLSVQLRETAELISPNPLGSSQCLPRIRKACRPMQWQSSFFGLRLQGGIHQAIARPRWNAPERNVRMGLECQLIDVKSVADEDCVSVLSDVAERAQEVVPVQHCSKIIRESPLVDLRHILCRRG